jgi:hypothetical protein
MARTKRNSRKIEKLPTKRIDSQAPDVTIIVGSGDNVEETRFYGVILASASPYLDAMLSNGMMESENRIIRFPEKNPLQWDVVLRCIDPSNALLFTPEPRVDDILSSYQDAPRVLAPWFNELQMQPYLNRCDEILCTKIDENITHEKIRDGRVTSAEMAKLVEDLTFAINYNLTNTRDEIESKIMGIMENFLWGFGDVDHFDIATVKNLLQSMSPIQMVGGEKNTTNDKPAAKKQRRATLPSYKPSNCVGIWYKICSCLDMAILSSDMMNDINGFSQLVYYSLQRAHKRMKQNLKEIAQALVGKNGFFSIITKPTNETVQFGENGKTISDGDVDKAIMTQLKGRIIEGNCLGRSYRLANDEKVITMAWRQKYSLAQKERDFPAVEPKQQTIRFCETDFTVKVGHGAAAKEFQCHKTILAFASKKLDVLVKEASNDLLLLPDVNPDVWE